MATDLLEAETAVTDFSAHPAGAAVADRIEETRRQVVQQRSIARGLWTIAFALAIFATWTWIDFAFELAWGLRALGLVGVISAVAYFAATVLRRRFPDYPLASAAADVENALPALGQRLRTTLDYVRADAPAAPAAPALLRALATDTSKLSRTADFSEIVSAKPVLLALAITTVAAAAWFVAFIASGEWRIATGRALLLPLQYTTVTVIPAEDQTIRAGESVAVTANIAGRPIQAATLRYRPTAGGEWKTLELRPLGDEPKKPASETDGEATESLPLLGKVSASIADCRADFDFEVLAGPKELRPVHVRVLQPLTIASFQAEATPPAYTRKPAEAFTDWSFKAPEGSQVTFDIELNRAAETATLRPVADKAPDAATESVPLRFEGNHIRGAFADLRQSGKWELTARTADGIDLKPQRLSIRVLPDARAKIRFLEPVEHLDVIATAEVPLVVEAADDVSLLRFGIAAQVGDGPLTTIWERQITGGTTDEMRGEKILALEDYQLTFQDGVTYHAFADDQYFENERRTTTPLRFVDIRPFKLTFQMVESGGACKGCSTTLEELIARQRQNLSLTFAAHNDGDHSAGMAERLKKYEGEIAAVTQELADGFIAQGTLQPELLMAAQAMNQAVAAFSKNDWDGALEKEQSALRDLIRARQNIRRMLSNSSSPSASACRKFDRQMRQKLRTPEELKKDRQQQLSESRKELEQLAQQQRKWSEELSPPDSGSPLQPQNQQSQQQQKSSASQSSSSSSSSSQQQAAQQKMLEKLQELREQLAAQQGNTPAGEQAAEQAAKAMQDGLDDLSKQEPDAAAEAGQQAAEQLEQLANHLANMNAQDAGERLKRSTQLADQLAAEQKKVSEQLSAGKQSPGGQTGSSGSQGSTAGSNGELTDSARASAARRERALAAQAQMLHELLAGLQAGDLDESGEMSRALGEALKENSPAEIGDTLNEAAEKLDAADAESARESAANAASELDQLAAALRGIQSGLAQPQLEELLELEAKVAKLQRQLRSSGGAERQDAVEGFEAIEPRLHELASGDARLSAALEQLRNPSTASAHSSGGDQRADNQQQYGANGEFAPGHYLMRLSPGGGELKGVAKALQVKIQEAILAAALQDADEPAPPQYRQLVDEYYQALSDDLR